MRRALAWLLSAVAVLLLLGCLLAPARQRVAPPPADAPAVARPPRLSPDYAGAWLPVNLAPPDLTVQEPGTAYFVRASVAGGGAVTAGSRKPRLSLPSAAWRRAAGPVQGRRATVSFEVSVRDTAGRWSRFAPFTSTLADPIDRYLTYRSIGPVYNLYTSVSLRQRDLTDAADRLVLSGGPIAGGCVNCHTYHAGKADLMTFGVRSSIHGSSALLLRAGRVTKIDAIWGYNCCHPSGQAIAYSLNKVRQFFHQSTDEVRDVVDLDSDLVVYRLDTGAVEAAPAIADPNRLETYPCWSPDGRYLYYCSAPITWQDRDTVPPAGWRSIRYDLCRVPYDLASHTFGAPETLVAARDTGRSALLPRVSPDGRWLLLCLCDYGCFPVYQPSSDLYLLDLRTRACRRLDINSPRSESWHSWSSNSRWIAFSSKRADGVFTRTYLAYVEPDGTVHKPVPVPGQPTAAEGYLKTHSVPELSTEPVPVSAATLARAARRKQGVKLQMPEISMTKKKGAPAASEPWQGKKR